MHPIPRLGLFSLAIIALTIAAILVLQAGLPSHADYTGFQLDSGQVVAPEVNSLAPPFANPTLDGNIITLYDLRGNPVIINFWATWCGPCRVEMPELQSLYDDYGEQGLHILGVNLAEPVPLITAWVRDFGLTFDIVLDEQGQIATTYRLRGQPSTYVISPEGIITHVYYGPVNMDTLRAAVESYFVD